MSKNEKRFVVIGTIGSGSELRAIPRNEPVYSFHVTKAGNEIAIRYDRESAWDAGSNVLTEEIPTVQVWRKSIFREVAP